MRLIEITLSPYENRLLRTYRTKVDLDLNDFVAMSDEDRKKLLSTIAQDNSRYPTPKTEPDYYYHGTTKAAALNIKKEGLTIDERDSKWRLHSAIENSRGRIFFSPDLDVAEKYAFRTSHKQPVILRIKASDLPPHQVDTEEDNSVYIEENVPPNILEIWTGKKWARMA